MVLIIFITFICMCVPAHAHAPWHVCQRSEVNLQESVLSFHYMDPKDQTQAWQQAPLPDGPCSWALDHTPYVFKGEQTEGDDLGITVRILSVLQ